MLIQCKNGQQIWKNANYNQWEFMFCIWGIALEKGQISVGGGEKKDELLGKNALANQFRVN